MPYVFLLLAIAAEVTGTSIGGVVLLNLRGAH